MQTFLPYADFKKSAQVLDYRRLGKQRVEAKQMIDAIEGRTDGWKNHPCTKMWQNNVTALKYYFNIISSEWIARGYKHNMGFFDIDDNVDMPEFIGNEDFHSRHRAALLAKNTEFYSKYDWSEEPKIDYIWFVGK